MNNQDINENFYLVFGQSAVNGVELAVDKYNAQGGILDKKIETVVYDDKGQPSKAVLAFEKLAKNDKVHGVKGPCSICI